MTRTRQLPLVVGLSLVALTACGDDSSSDGSGAPLNVAGRSFAAVSADGFTLPPASTLVISFEQDGQLGVSGGCNLIGGAYTLDGNVLTAPDGFFQTEMACDEPLMQLDAAVVELLSASPTLSVDGEVLTITGPSSSLALSVQQPPADLSLEGTLWTVTSLVDGDAVSGGFSVAPTIQFVDGSAQVFAGCNRGSATVTVSDTAIEFGPLGLTKMACQGDAMQVEAAVVAVLQGSVDYRIEGTTLEIIGADGGLLLDGATPA